MTSTTTLQECTTLPRSELLPGGSWPEKVTVDISLLLKPRRDDEEPLSASRAGTKSPTATTTRSVPTPISIIAPPGPGQGPPPPPPLSQSTHPNSHLHLHSSTPASSIPAKRPARPLDHPTGESPAKKQSKWSPEEDTKIIQLRGDGMKWEDISKHLPGRSAISCRLHYQNYLERRSEWDEDRKNKLARLYERFKADMWARIAEEMAIPWRAAEAMHWQMGEHEMARRAGVTPFSLTTTNTNNVTIGRTPHHLRNTSATPRMRRESMVRSAIPPQQLPSLAELTAGLPAYAQPPVQSHTRQYTIHAQGALTPPHVYYHHPSSHPPQYHTHVSPSYQAPPSR